ncbi:hypothetical protein AAG570_003854 [Ranatra chinensis]|uniref:U3 small nucleolar RNA-associated protein 15 homolog n=1 Tax=Ranatra chinensis TaxID=642074 RepID=A0ABD0YGN2_9HEMI
MSIFKKTNSKIYAKPTQKVTADTAYWKQLGVPTILKEFGPIDYIDFSPVEPHYFAVTCSVRVQLYNPITKLVHKTLSRFRETAYGARFRSDGLLICAGDEEANVKLFDVNTQSLLRVFKGHTGPVHRSCFTSDQYHLASFSDDKTVRVWDIPTEKKVHEFTSHGDYIRAGAASPVSPSTIVSGCYDNQIRMFDSRTSDGAVFTVDHGSPVESVLFLPSGGVFISAGGTEIRVWDALAGGRLIARVSQHHKSITSICLASNGSRLLSASLDRHVKIYDVSTYKVVHNIDHPNSILSLGVSANDETLALGTVDGLISVSRREEDKSTTNAKKKKAVEYKYMGDKYTPPAASSVDSTVPLEHKPAMSKHDACLRKFQYSKALDCVLATYVINKVPNVTVALLQELIRRKGLQNAIINRDDKSLVPLLKFVVRYINDCRFTSVLIDVANVVIDCCEDRLDELSPENLDLLRRLSRKLKEEEDLTLELLRVSGGIRMLLAASTVDSDKHPPPPVPTISPSTNAQQPFILNVS